MDRSGSGDAQRGAKRGRDGSMNRPPLDTQGGRPGGAYLLRNWEYSPRASDKTLNPVPFLPDPFPDLWPALDLDPEEIGRLVRRHPCGGLADVERIHRTKAVSESPNEMTARINPQNPIRKENRTASSRWWL